MKNKGQHSVASSSTKVNEPSNGSIIQSHLKSGLAQVIERPRSIQKKRSPKPEKELAGLQ